MARHATFSRDAARGFTVLEVLIAAAVISIGFAAIFALLGRGSALHREAVDRTHASMLAASVLEDVAMHFARTPFDENPYRDANGNGTPDSFEDLDGSGVEDRFEAHGGVLANRLPGAPGYRYTLVFRPSLNNPEREMLVTCRVGWQDGESSALKEYKRIVFIKRGKPTAGGNS